MNERLERRGKGGVEIGAKRLFVLMYADDAVLLAKEKRGMRLMIKELRVYLKEKGLEMNSRKSKIMRFKKRVGKE